MHVADAATPLWSGRTCAQVINRLGILDKVRPKCSLRVAKESRAAWPSPCGTLQPQDHTPWESEQHDELWQVCLPVVGVFVAG